MRSVATSATRAALDRIRAIRRLDERHHFTLVCRDLSEFSIYARVDNTSYRILKHYTPGPFTFLLPATRDVPSRLVHPKRRTIGLRVPDHVIAQALLEALGEPMMSTSLILPDASEALTDPEEIRDRLEQRVELDHRRRIVRAHGDDSRRPDRRAAGACVRRRARRVRVRIRRSCDPCGIMPRSERNAPSTGTSD